MHRVVEDDEVALRIASIHVDRGGVRVALSERCVTGATDHGGDACVVRGLTQEHFARSGELEHLDGGMVDEGAVVDGILADLHRILAQSSLEGVDACLQGVVHGKEIALGIPSEEIVRGFRGGGLCEDVVSLSSRYRHDAALIGISTQHDRARPGQIQHLHLGDIGKH